MNLKPLMKRLSEIQIALVQKVGHDTNDYLLGSMPTLEEWQKATADSLLNTRAVMDPEVKLVDQFMAPFSNNLYFNPGNGERAQAVRNVSLVVKHYLRNTQYVKAPRRPAFQILETITDILLEYVIFDAVKFSQLVRSAVVPKAPDVIRGGFSEVGETFEKFRVNLLLDICNPACERGGFDTYNQAWNKAKGHGLLPGGDFHGGNCCHSAPDHLKRLPGFTMDINGRIREIPSGLKKTRSTRRDHQFLKAGETVVDGTWRQFFRELLPGYHHLMPGIFIGTKAELVTLLERLGSGKSDWLVEEMYAGK